MNLDIGSQPGTWMPKRFPGWAESGARLGLDVQVTFTDKPSSIHESLVGPKDTTYELDVSSTKSTFVSERGQEFVDFTSGGWCIQRPTANVKNAGGSLVKPEGLLRFWLDCPSGAKRRDVEIQPNTRIFFTTGVWDIDVSSIESRYEEYYDICHEMDKIADRTRQTRSDGENNNMFENTVSFLDLVQDSKDYDRLKVVKEQYEQELPPVGAARASNGVKIAPTGSLVIKGNNIPDWLPGSEYLILGTFSTKAIENKE